MAHHLVSDQSNSYILWLDHIRLKLYPKRFTKTYVLLLVALSSSLFYLSWCSSWFGFLLCLAIVPMLAIMKLLATTPEKKTFCWTAIVLTLFLWNTLTLWWVYNAASFEGFFFVTCGNTFCLTLPWFFYYHTRKWGGLYLGYLGLITSWLTLEHAHLSWTYWELTFPWLNLGNGLAALPQWIQWYEHTGILGGSLWMLIINILLYHLLFEKASPALLKLFLGTLLLPISISLMIYCTYKEKGIDVEAVVVQPNFDNYTEKDRTSSSFVPYPHQIDRLLTLSKQQLTPQTCLVVWPEAAIDGGLLETRFRDYVLVQPIFQFLETYAFLHLITGVHSERIYGLTKTTQTARKIRGGYIGSFNSVFYLKTGKKIDIHHKAKLLPGGEYIPYVHLLPEEISTWLKQKFIDIGGVNPCFEKGNNAKVFEIDAHIKVAPIICYELLYGAFVGSSVQQGANLLSVATNDGWWGNTPIYHQFFQYSRLIAIAHRRSVMRAANTGISGFINQRGAAIATTNRLEVAAMRAVVRANNQMTFYSLYGDYIGHIASWTCLLLFCILIYDAMAAKKANLFWLLAKVKYFVKSCTSSIFTINLWWVGIKCLFLN